MSAIVRTTVDSPSLDGTMPVLRVGDRGLPLVYVPSSAGNEEEFLSYGMHADCSPWIESGRVQVFSIDGFGPRGLFSDALPPPERVRAYVRFERHLANELLPWIVEQTREADLGVVGSSYGAFVAANLLFKYPERVRFAGGLGGVYAHGHRLHGYRDDDVYFHTPPHYLTGLRDGAILDAIRATRGIALYGAADDEWLPSTLGLARILRAKRLPHHTEVWPSPASHHERWWKLQIRRFLGRYVGPV